MSGEQNVEKSAVGRRWGRLTSRRSKLILSLLVLGPLFVLVASLGMMQRDRRPMTPDDAVPDIVPSEQFQHDIELVREQNLTILQVSDYPVTDDLVSELSDLEWIETVILDQGILTDESMATLAGLPNLQHLRLRLSPITDEGLAAISKCQSLGHLNLPHAECTAAGVAHLQNLPRLRQLRLGSARLGDDVTDQIAKIKGLRGIHLIGVPVTDQGLERLATMPHLESLYLDDAAVTEAGWERLFREHPNLHVHINQKHHDRDPKAHRHHD
jgi:hypothetical protein